MGVSATDLTRDRVDFLIRELSAKFAARPIHRRAVLSVLEPIAEEWSWCKQGMDGDNFDRMNAALVSHLETLLVVPVDQSDLAIAQLVGAWEKVRSAIAWD